MLGFFFDGLSCLLMSFHLLWASRPRKKNNSSTACAAWPKVKFLSPGLKAKNALFWAVLAAVSWWVSQVRRMESSRIPLKIFVQGMDSLCKFLAQHRMPPKIPRVKKTNAKAFWTNGLWWANYQTASNGLKFERCWGVWLLNKTFMPETWVVCVFFFTGKYARLFKQPCAPIPTAHWISRGMTLLGEVQKSLQGGFFRCHLILTPVTSVL